jgi:hypothetical protein
MPPLRPNDGLSHTVVVVLEQIDELLDRGELNYWLWMAGVQPRLNWPGRPGVVAAMAVKLRFECSRTDGLAVCTSCGTPFLPQARRPRRDHNPYCSDCGLKAAQRDAAARYRQAQKYRATYDTWLQKRRRPST